MGSIPLQCISLAWSCPFYIVFASAAFAVMYPVTSQHDKCIVQSEGLVFVVCRFYYVLTEEEEEARKRATLKKHASTLIRRPIKHPNFHNVTPLQATEMLRDANLGAFLLRPSIKHATSAIAITIKVHTHLHCLLGKPCYQESSVWTHGDLSCWQAAYWVSRLAPQFPMYVLRNIERVRHC